MMYLTEIDVITSEKKVLTFDGPLITADSPEEAKELAFEMNTELKIVGEYVESIDSHYGMELLKL